MGRYSTVVTKVNNACCIDIDNLKESNVLVKNKCVVGSIGWSNGNEIGIESYLSEDDSYLRLVYNCNSVKYDYTVTIVSVPSNLGVGRVIYFLCPTSGKRCRKLYRAYGSHEWKSREAQQNRLYYSSQLSAKNDYHNDRYWHYERVKVPQLLKKCKNTQYKGKPTKAMEKYYDALDEMRVHDIKRWVSISGVLLKNNPSFVLN